MTITATSPGPLASAAMASLKTFFETKDHRPSADHWDALRDIANTMEAMANGTCPTKVFLSAIDPGCGKTTTCVHFAKALTASAEHDDVGMLICVGRIKEAQQIAEALKDHRDRLAVLIGGDDPGWGDIPKDRAHEAQILITTQQRIERVTDGRNFADISAFRYRGQPRRVRVWDEAWLPGVAIALNEDDLGFLFGPIRRLSTPFHAAMLEFFLRLNTAVTGDLVDVPDWEHLFGVSLQDVLARLPAESRRCDDGGPPAAAADRLRDDQRMAATSIFILAGKTARVVRDNYTGAAVLSYQDTLPEDLAPLLVLDASGRVRQTYADMERHRGIVRLRPAVKDYSPLTVYWWAASGSKTGWEKHGSNRAEGIAKTILTRPDEQWLVVIHKADPKVKNVDNAIRRHLPPEVRAKVKMLPWGQHMATNEHADVPNLILAGTLFMRPSYYLALTHLARDQPTVTGLATIEDVQRTTQGEHANLVLQAICRGRVRKSDGNKCRTMNAYVIASPRSGIGDALPTIFPGCNVKHWDPMARTVTPKGKLGEAIIFVRQRIAEGAQRISYVDVQKAIGSNSKVFQRDVTTRREWLEAITALNLEPAGGRRRMTGLRVRASETADDPTTIIGPYRDTDNMMAISMQQTSGPYPDHPSALKVDRAAA